MMNAYYVKISSQSFIANINIAQDNIKSAFECFPPVAARDEYDKFTLTRFPVMERNVFRLVSSDAFHWANGVGYSFSTP